MNRVLLAPNYKLTVNIPLERKIIIDESHNRKAGTKLPTKT
jgi:hypothetical protein